MALETVSAKKNRVYVRAFDHDEARRLRSGSNPVPYSELAELFGVSDTAVRRVCDPNTNRKLAQHTLENARRKRQPCLGGCGTLVWRHGRRERSGYCPRCLKALEAAPNVRPDELRCTKCGEWKPDEAFSPSKRHRARRGRIPACRQCDTAARRDYRRRHSIQERTASRNYKRKINRTGGRPMAKYLVLSKNGDGWKEIGHAEATTPAQAVERTVEIAGTYVAVAETHIVDVEPVTTLKATTRHRSNAAA